MPFSRPDVLVLAGGGLIGEAWMTGVLAGMETASGIDFRECEGFVGTSAGSIVSAHLAAGRRPRTPDFPASDLPDELPELDDDENRALAGMLIGGARRTLDGVGRAAAASLQPFAAGALMAAAPGGALARAALLSRLPADGRRLEQLHANIERLDARFDGRLRVTAVDRRRGTRTVFGGPGAPPAAVADAVAASCTVPWLFAPVRIGRREYVDGGVWSPTNLDAAPVRRGTDVLCLHPTARFPVTAGSALAAIRVLSRPQVSTEVLALQRRGARVRVIGPNDGARDAMGQDFMAPDRRAEALAAGYDQGRTVSENDS
ncbi:MAG TPA: patatin-like phospholipase family protein [Solirubrobacteraceae bacterium]|nr:patatin-like phospholipase family protein [Solirubrobacteraceae bacterium]